MNSAALLRKRAKIAADLPLTPEIVRGSLLHRVIRHRTGCAVCANGDGHPVWVLTVSYPGGRTRQFSLSPEQKPVVEQWLSVHVQPSLEHHQQSFQHAPEDYAGDRGFHNAENVQKCKDAGVSLVCLPQRGGQKSAEQEELESSRAFKKGQKFRAGIEGRISVLFRGRGMKRCLFKGRERFEILVGAAVLANNLMRIVDILEKHKSKRGRAAA